MGPVRALRIHQKSAPSSSALYIQGTEKGQGKRWDCRKSWKSPNRFASCLSDQKLLNSQAKLLWSISIPIEMQAETKWSQGENHFTLLDHFHGSRWRCSNFFFFFCQEKVSQWDWAGSLSSISHSEEEVGALVLLPGWFWQELIFPPEAGIAPVLLPE